MTGTAEPSSRSSRLSSLNSSVPETKTVPSISQCSKLFTCRYLPQTFPAPVQISALHLPRTCTSRQATIKNCSVCCAANWFHCRKGKRIPLWKGSEEGSRKSSPENLVLRVSPSHLDDFLRGSSKDGSTPTSKPEETALLCFCLAPLSEQQSAAEYSKPRVN